MLHVGCVENIIAFAVTGNVSITSKNDSLQLEQSIKATLCQNRPMVMLAVLSVSLCYANVFPTIQGYLPVVTPDVIKAGVVVRERGGGGEGRGVDRSSCVGDLLLFVQEGCGFQPRGVSTQVYTLHPRHGHLCLTGTAEIPLAGASLHSKSFTF